MKIFIFSAILCSALFTAFAQDPPKPNEPVKPITKTQELNSKKDELKAEYELILQKQKNNLAELEAELNRISMENKLAAEKQQNELRKIKADLEKLSNENKLTEEKLKSITAAKSEELAKLSMENKLAAEKQQNELRQIKADLEKLFSENKLAEEKLKSVTAAKSEELAKISLENRLAAETNKKTLIEVSKQIEKQKLENELKSEKNKEEELSRAKEKAEIDMERQRIALKDQQLKIEKLVLDSKMDKLNNDLVHRAKKEEWKKESNTEPVYWDQPFQKDQLVISDRRISLNGPILREMADYVTERMHYFNNISTAPIFIVIDYSPGGSVMAGYRIVKAMQASKAPVHVAVKSFAASMAAIITTLAEKSYVYPNAIILHHQMSAMNWGNMTQLKEQLELAREWERRLMAPLSKKMGLDIESLRKKMYEKSSDGDWEEFGDKAVAYKWATSVVDRIEETGFIKNPDYAKPVSSKPFGFGYGLEEKVNEKGERYMVLPRLEPFDFYFIYNPDKYYR